MEKKQNNKAKDAVKQFHNACNLLACTINEQLFDGDRRWYWIGDEVGGLCDFDDLDVLKPEDMVRIIDHGMTYDQYAEWRDANLDNNNYINLRSWLMGLRHEMIKPHKDADGGQTWQKQAEESSVFRWAYLDDILPEKGGGE